MISDFVEQIEYDYERRMEVAKKNEESGSYDFACFCYGQAFALARIIENKEMAVEAWEARIALSKKMEKL